MYDDRSDSVITIILVTIFVVIFFGISSCVGDLRKKEVESCIVKGGQWVQVNKDYFYCVMPQ